MAFDGFFTHAMIVELKNRLCDGRVTKISQPYPNEVILTIRAQRTNYPLLLSANANYARFQITEIPYTNPPVPTNFTMMLRKYLEGAKLVDIQQLENDRVVYFSFLTRNELGDALPLLLSVEVMGRHSNIILINQAEQKIIDTIKHVGMDQNRYRTFLPNATYRTPPKQEKVNPFASNASALLQDIDLTQDLTSLAKELMQNYQGFDRNTAFVLAQYLQAPNINPRQEFLKFLDDKQGTPCIYQHENKMMFSSVLPFFTNKCQTFTTLSLALDAYYQQKATTDRVAQQGANLIHVVNVNLKRNRLKLTKLTRELQQTKGADKYRIYGELLTTYLYQIKRGMLEISLPNYYDNEKMTTIPLSNQLNPAQNAQKYFKKYQKLKNAVVHITKQIELTKAEIAYFEELEAQLQIAKPQDLPDIKLELENGGYLKANHKKTKRKVKLSQPEVFLSSDGTRISVGKNNLQNDQLTLKTAKKSDVWLHAKNIPGSHVIIHSATPSHQTLLEAANLAAYYSKSRLSANVAVDYVTVNKIRKPNGAKPGFVIYEGQKTLYVTPDEKLITQLALNQE
jgi:predicted ribosome quality control (RQC) complex YloA/Tae2 family protein